MRLRLLLVDDDAVDRLTIGRALRQAGVAAEIVEAHTAPEALAAALVPDAAFDAVLLDYQLPGGDGLSVLQALRQAQPVLPVIALTGYGDERLAAAMMKAGAADYLSKHGLTADQLERSLRHALALAAAERERQSLLAREQAAREEAQAANRAKDEFLATLSHELRTPLNAILGWARLLTRDSLDPAGFRRAVATIERNALLQVSLIDDLLDVSRIISGKLRLEYAATDVAALVAAAVDSARPTAAARQLTLHFDRRSTPLIQGDPARLQQVVTNLLSNAIKFTPEGGRIDVAVDCAGEHIVVTVADSGRGIDATLLPHIFERFWQGDASHTRRQGGLGLGLSIVKHLLDLHGADIRVHSDGPGAGSVFTVTLPVTAPPPAVHARLDPHPSVGSLAGLRILVVDDHDDSRDVIATALEASGAVARRAGSASAALLDAMQHRPDVVISDIAMPGDDGYTLVQQLRAMNPAPAFPAIAVTAFASPDDRARALAAGFNAHLAKPIDPDTLVATVVQLVSPAVATPAAGDTP